MDANQNNLGLAHSCNIDINFLGNLLQDQDNMCVYFVIEDRLCLHPNKEDKKSAVIVVDSYHALSQFKLGNAQKVVPT